MDIGSLARIGEWMDAATDARQLPDPQRVVARTEDTNDASSALYIRALRSRLVSLGYLDAEFVQGDALTPELRLAIFDFQREAGFALDEVDAWAGPRTKQKLQQLISFEDEQDVRSWGRLGEDPAAYPAVERAVYLRLFTLGCFADWRQPLGRDTAVRLDDNPALRAALRRFLDIAQALGLVTSALPAVLDTRVLSLLFGYDALIRALGAHPGFCEDAANHAFVNAIGRVELWLLGYEVAIARGPVMERVRVHGHGPHVADSFRTAEADVEAALDDFRAKQGLGSANLTLGAAFFSQAAQLADAQVDESDTAMQAAVLQDAATHAGDIVDRLNQLASRVWDGLRRAWAWLKAAVSHAVQAVEDRLWNLARVIASGARSAYEMVLKAIDVVHRGVAALRARVREGSEPGQAMLGYGVFFDATLFVAADSDGERMRRLVDSDADEGRCFSLACELVGLLVSALQQVIDAVTVGAGLGWFVLLLGLSRLRGTLLELGAEFARLKDFELPGDSIYLNPVR